MTCFSVYPENRSDSLLGTVVCFKNHFCSMMSDDGEDSISFVLLEVVAPPTDTDDTLPPSLNSITAVIPTATPPPEDSSILYGSVRLEEDLWKQRLQDTGSTLESLPKNITSVRRYLPLVQKRP